MNKSNRFIIFVALLMMCVFVFTACSGYETGAGGTVVYTVEKNGKEIEVTNTELEISGDIPFEEKEVISEEGKLYAGYNSFQEAFSFADVVVYGRVREVKPGIYQETYNKTLGEKGKHPRYYTPIVLDVITCYKGEESERTITFYSPGAETNDKIIKEDAYPTFDIDVGDRMLVFLSENFGVYGYISPEMEDGNFYVDSDLLNNKRSDRYIAEEVQVENFVERINNEAQTYKSKNK